MRRLDIITSVFNNGDLLKGLFDNISKQTIFNECQWYIIDCGSPVDHKIIEDFYDTYPYMLHYIRYDDDPGIYAAWNDMIKFGESPYITNANVDDRLHPECFEKHVNLLDQRPNIDLAYCYNLCSFDPNIDFGSIHKNANRYPTDIFSPAKMLRHNLPHNHPVWRRSLHDRFGYFDVNMKSASDWEFWLRCVAGGATFQLIPEDLGIYYWNPKGMSTNKQNQHFKIREENTVRNKYKGLIV